MADPLPRSTVTVQTPGRQTESFASRAFLLVSQEPAGVRLRTRATSDDMPALLAMLVNGLVENLVRAGMEPMAAAHQVAGWFQDALSDGLGAMGLAKIAEFTGTARRLDG